MRDELLSVLADSALIATRAIAEECDGHAIVAPRSAFTQQECRLTLHARRSTTVTAKHD
jgi:hypothetical protein